MRRDDVKGNATVRRAGRVCGRLLADYPKNGDEWAWSSE